MTDAVNALFMLANALHYLFSSHLLASKSKFSAVFRGIGVIVKLLFFLFVCFFHLAIGQIVAVLVSGGNSSISMLMAGPELRSRALGIHRTKDLQL